VRESVTRCEAVFSIPPRREMTLIFADFQHDADRNFDNRNDQKLGKNGKGYF
jgi:hypothetical protein